MYLPGEIDWRVMSMSAGISLIATIIVGLVPAFQTRNLELAGALKVESTGWSAPVEQRGCARAWWFSRFV